MDIHIELLMLLRDGPGQISGMSGGSCNQVALACSVQLERTTLLREMTTTTAFWTEAPTECIERPILNHPPPIPIQLNLSKLLTKTG